MKKKKRNLIVFTLNVKEDLYATRPAGRISKTPRHRQEAEIARKGAQHHRERTVAATTRGEVLARAQPARVEDHHLVAPNLRDGEYEVARHIDETVLPRDRLHVGSVDARGGDHGVDLASESNRIEALVSLVRRTQLRCDSHLGKTGQR